MMQKQTATKTARLYMRVPPEVLEAVKLAAEIEGRSASAFIVDAARHRAEQSHQRTPI